MAHRDASLRRTDWVAIGGIADMRERCERPDATRLTQLRHRRFKTFAAQKHCSFLRQSVISSLHCMNDPQPEGHMTSHIERRKFSATLGVAAAWPLVARAQQPLVGFVNAGSFDAPLAAAFRKGLNDTGYIESHNVTVEYHWLEGQF